MKTQEFDDLVKGCLKDTKLEVSNAKWTIGPFPDPNISNSVEIKVELKLWIIVGTAKTGVEIIGKSITQDDKTSIQNAVVAMAEALSTNINLG